MTAREMAAALLEIDNLNAWLEDSSDLAIEIAAAARRNDNEAAWLQRCIMDNDARSLRRAAKSILTT